MTRTRRATDPGLASPALHETTAEEPGSKPAPTLHVAVSGGLFERLSTGESRWPLNVRVETNNRGSDIRLDFGLNEFGVRKPRAGLVIELGARTPGPRKLIPYQGGSYNVAPDEAMLLYWELPPHRMYRTCVGGTFQVLEHLEGLGSRVQLRVVMQALDGQQVSLEGDAFLPLVSGEKLPITPNEGG
ncbi:MAG: hypothetical protein ACKO6N_02380 [Myxococcota bacterium]